MEMELRIREDRDERDVAAEDSEQSGEGEM